MRWQRRHVVVEPGFIDFGVSPVSNDLLQPGVDFAQQFTVAFRHRNTEILTLKFGIRHQFTGQTFADRTVTDQLGRQVTLPDHVTRVVVLQHQTLNLLVQLHAAEDIVGVLSSWQKQLGPQFARFMPKIAQLATPGDLTQVNIESLLALCPQVVFVANYAPPAMIAQIQQAGIPVVAISLRHDAAGEKNKMNPTMADEEQAYNAGLMEGIRLIGEVVERQPEAEALIHYTFEARKQANAPVADIPQNQRVRVYMANPDLNTYGAGKYTGLMMAHAGALNVAAASVKGARQVSLEQVLEWNPQVIFVQDRYPQVVKQIENDPQWQTIDAVKHHRVWLMPEYAKAWGYPMPEALALGELWMAKKLYPARYQSIDVDSKARDYYQRFYRVAWTPDAR
ncbi:putative ABC transport system periplasmic binding component [Klebsiella pneumoniae]|nr:putative ABC transport system periplasmic binding component [Klebsiella pneumoniae]